MAVRTRSVLGHLRNLLNNNTGENYDDDHNLIVGTDVFIQQLDWAEGCISKNSDLLVQQCEIMIITAMADDDCHHHHLDNEYDSGKQ